MAIDYANNERCRPFNIGHRLGGDLPGNSDNTLTAMYAVASSQPDKCFRYWELDVGQAADGLVLWHDFHVGDRWLIQTPVSDLPDDVVTTEQFIEALRWLRIVRPVVIDLKYVPAPDYWDLLLKQARAIRDYHQVPVWFITAANRVEVYGELCKLVGQEFSIRLYGGEGDFCEVVKAYNQLTNEGSGEQALP